MRSLKRLGVMFAAAMLVALTVSPGIALAADENHGIGLNKGCIGATKVGDPYRCSYGVTNNQDEANDTLTITSLVDVVNRPGSPSSGNILQIPGIGSVISFDQLPRQHDDQRLVHGAWHRGRDLHPAGRYPHPDRRRRWRPGRQLLHHPGRRLQRQRQPPADRHRLAPLAGHLLERDQQLPRR